MLPVIMVNCDLPRRLNLAKRTEFLARRAQAKPNGVHVFEKYQILVIKIMACRNLEIVLCSCTSEPIFLELPGANSEALSLFLEYRWSVLNFRTKNWLGRIQKIGSIDRR